MLLFCRANTHKILSWFCTVEVWEWISNFIPHLKMNVITYPCWVRLIHISKMGYMGIWWVLSQITTSNGSWCMGIKGEMSGTVCVTFTWDMYIYIYIWVVYSLCFFCCLFITVTWWYVWCFEWASGNQEEVQAYLSYHATVYTKPL